MKPGDLVNLIIDGPDSDIVLPENYIIIKVNPETDTSYEEAIVMGTSFPNHPNFWGKIETDTDIVRTIRTCYMQRAT